MQEFMIWFAVLLAMVVGFIVQVVGAVVYLIVVGPWVAVAAFCMSRERSK